MSSIAFVPSTSSSSKSSFTTASRPRSRVFASRETIIPFRVHDLERVVASSSSPPIVIAPGFGNESNDYDHALGCDNASLVKSLTSRGFAVYVAKVRRRDWFAGALRGVFTVGFWRNACATTESYGWFLRALDDAVNEAIDATQAKEVTVVAHSAGGWLARAYVGGAAALATGRSRVERERLARETRVRALVCLGTPHTQDSKTDPTRGANKWVNDTWPGAYFASSHGVKYVCVAGRAVVGDASSERGSITRYSSGSYAVVAGGDGDGVVGDAVVPNSAALALEGAETVVLDGVWHSMSSVGTFNAPAAYPWYGSDEVVDAWLAKL